MRQDATLDPAALKQAGRPKEFTGASLIEALPAQGATYSEWLAIAGRAGVSESTFKRLVRELRDTGSVDHLNGRYCRPAHGGKP